MKVTRSGECGNSPKNAFVEDFIIALVLSDDPGDRLSQDAQLPDIGLENATSLTILHAISHGRIGAANGEAVVNGETVAFAFVLEFTSTKGNCVRRIDFYRHA
jgi:hypothetical protein